MNFLIFWLKKNLQQSRFKHGSGVILYCYYSHLHLHNIPSLFLWWFSWFGFDFFIFFLLLGNDGNAGKTGISSTQKPCEATSFGSRGVREKTSSYSFTVHACPCKIASHNPCSPTPHVKMIIISSFLHSFFLVHLLLEKIARKKKRLLVLVYIYISSLMCNEIE